MHLRKNDRMRAGDTVLIVSDGVWDNFPSLELSCLVGNAYTHKLSPQDLAKEVVGRAISHGYEANGAPDDSTCLVGYVWEEY